jgi:hypothetical protein
MKIEVFREVNVKEVIDVEFPYYYINYYGQGTFYGKIEENKHTQIYICNDWREDSDSYSLEIEPNKASTMGCYFKDEHKSTESEYLSAKEKFISALQSS